MKKNQKLIIANDPEGMLAAIRELFQEQQSAYMGMDMEKLPESVRPFIKGLKEKVDGALLKLSAKPTDMVDGANTANCMLRDVSYALTYYRELYDSAMERLQAIAGEFEPKAQSLMSFETRVTKGDLIEKSKAEEMVKAAETALAAKFQLFGVRRQALMAAALPVPATDGALEGDDKAFDALKSTAQERVKKMTDLGMTEALLAAEVSDLAYGPEADFSKAVRMAEKLSGKRAGEGEPLQGGTGEGASSSSGSGSGSSGAGGAGKKLTRVAF